MKHLLCIAEKQSERIIKIILIFSCLFIIVDLSQLTLIHYITLDISRTIFGILFILPFIVVVYKLIRHWNT